MEDYKIAETPKYILDSLLKDRFLFVCYENIPQEFSKSELYLIILNYLHEYVTYNLLDINTLSCYYLNFIKSYNEDCKEFSKTQMYPYNRNHEIQHLSREEYDIILILSTLFTSHRFRIMKIIYDFKYSERDKSLFLGSGSGLELYLTYGKIGSSYAFDLTFNKFLTSYFANIKFHTELFDNQFINFFELIFAIELLEHLQDPYELISKCYNALSYNGKLFLTTATNIPQFDHLYNFSANHEKLEKFVKQIGFSILFKETIKHNLSKVDIGSANHFYILIKSK